MPINCINIRDKTTDGTGAFANIKEGGINYKYVVLHFKSQRGNGIRFIVDIYAQYPYVQSIYPSIVAQQPAGFIYPTNVNQQLQQQYAFGRN